MDYVLCFIRLPKCSLVFIMRYSPYRKDLLELGRQHANVRKSMAAMLSTLPVSKRIAKQGKAVRKRINLLHWKKTLQYNPAIM